MTELSMRPATDPASARATGSTTTPIPGIADLRRAVSGPVWDPGDVDVVTELAGFNLAPTHEPVALVAATSAADVAATVRWARVRGIGVAVVATGHADFSHRGVVVVSTKRLDRCEVDASERTVTVGAGVKWARVLEAAAPHGLSAVTGSSSDVGAVGFTTGGGIGPVVRRFGYGCDRVRRMRVVTGDGQIREVSPTSDPELFRAMLGGKDAAGIVVEMTVELVEMTRFYGGSIFFDGADAPAVMHAWRTWQQGLTENTTTSIAILRAPDMEAVPPPLRGRTVIQLRVAHLGPEIEGLEVVGPMRKVATPIVDMVTDMPAGAIDAVHCDPTEPMPCWTTGAFVDTVEADTVDALLDAAGPQRELPVILVELRAIGGAGMRGTAGCLPRVPYVVGVVAPMVGPLVDVVPTVGHGILDALAPWSPGTVPVNFASPQTIAARPGACWTDAERARLAGVSRRVDPDGVLGGRRLGLR
ncbi:FAD-binding oxidoreductase [Actinomycetospora sp.]|uniref:FAD-binding oxidoreductase n=1 Tax=Actinomycetospora sp. TaxID=1872135 RepID=UPI002F3E267C